MTSAKSLLLVVGATLGILGVMAVQAQTYPDRPITFIVPFAAGGLSDIPARLLAAQMQGRIGQSIIVENRPGASGITGGLFVERAEPDGYTLLVNALADTQNLHYLPVPYNAINDFALIGKITDGPPLVLIVNSNTPYKSVNDIIADAKANPNKVNFGIPVERRRLRLRLVSSMRWPARDGRCAVPWNRPRSCWRHGW